MALALECQWPEGFIPVRCTIAEPDVVEDNFMIR